jgi:hypothetical protein
MGSKRGTAEFTVRVLDARGRELSTIQEPTLHAALARARERLRERIDIDGQAHKAEVRGADGVIYDVFADGPDINARE